MSTPNKSPYNKAKKYSRFGRFSMDDFKREIRNDFKKRLADLRHANVDRNRASLCADIQRELEEMNSYIHENELMAPEELYHMLDVVKREILREELQEQGEKHEQELQQEINSILEGSSSTCTVCEINVSEATNLNVICDKCSEHFE